MAMGFRDVPIGQLCKKVTTGSTPLRSRREFYEGGTIDWYKTGELKDWYLDPAEERITQLALDETSVKLFPANTVLMAMYGDGKTITSLGMLRSPASTNQACSAMLVDEKQCDPCYFFYALKSRRRLLLNLASGGAQRNLSGKLIKEFSLPVPPLPVQQRIAGILSAYDDLIANNQRRIKILEEMARSLYREWFIHFRFPGHEKVKMVPSPLGLIPQGWEVRPLSALCTRMESGGTPKRKLPQYWEGGTIDWFKTGELWDGFLFDSEEKITEQGLRESSARIFHSGTILMAIYGSPTVGRLGIVTRPSCCNQAAIGLVADTNHICQTFLFFVLMFLRDQFNGLAQGAAQQNISKEKVANALAIVPPNLLIRLFDKFAEPVFAQIQTLQIRTINLRRTRDLLLPRLLSGQIELKSMDAVA